MSRVAQMSESSKIATTPSPTTTRVNVTPTIGVKETANIRRRDQHEDTNNNNNNNDDRILIVHKQPHSKNNKHNVKKLSKSMITKDVRKKLATNHDDDHQEPKNYYDHVDDDSDDDNDNASLKIEANSEIDSKFAAPIVWRNVFTMSLLHVFGFYGWYCCIVYAKWQTLVWAYLIGTGSGLGVLAGAHRLWTHRSYKAHWSVRTLLMLLQTLALQNDIYEWVRDHRTHHKYSETDADPHNSKRGFFFAHVGWLLCRKHPLVKSKGALIDMSDIWADPIVRFQRRFYIPLVLLIWGVFPVVVPVYCWNEPVLHMIFGNIFRYVVSLHSAWLVNSAAHIYGYQYYDKSLRPRENYLVTYLALGEGYHNYHHAFPWDYSASEHGCADCFNIATALIDGFAALGLVTDRRVVSAPLIEARIARTGDKSLAVPSFMTGARKFRHVALDMILGAIVSSWSLWLTWLLQLAFGFRHQLES